MQLTNRTKLSIGLGALAALFVYLIVLDVGLYAGRVHPGVVVGELDVGGLTQDEAQTLVARRGAIARRAPLVFSTEGYDCRATPAELGWRPRPKQVARRVMEVGRSGGLIRGLGDRARAWVGGVSVPWSPDMDPTRLDSFIQGCVERGEQFGVAVDPEVLQARLEALILQWPRDQIHELPLEG